MSQSKRIVTLSGGLRDGQQFESKFLTQTVKAPGAHEDSIPYLTTDGRLLRAYPTEVYRRTQDAPLVYAYDRTDPPAPPRATDPPTVSGER